MCPAWPNIHSTSAIALHQDANVFVSECDAGQSFDLQLAPQRQAYLVCAEGGWVQGHDRNMGIVNACHILQHAGLMLIGFVPVDNALKLPDQGIICDAFIGLHSRDRSCIRTDRRHSL